MKREQIKEYLDSLRATGDLRELANLRPAGKFIQRNGRAYLNFCSNDYLGLTEDDGPPHLGMAGRQLQWEFFRQLGNPPPFLMGNPSSRLMGGNTPEYEVLENSLGSLFPGRKKALVLSSGYVANAGVLPALTGKDDLLVADKSCHASLVDGLRLCQGDWLRFRHNDVNHLEDILRRHRDRYRNVWVVTESTFSMDGDRSPLREIVALKERYDLQIMLDEAHSFGLCGPGGAGYACELGVAPQVDVITTGLGKAVASTGGAVITDTYTRELLINRMRTLIFSTALPAVNLVWTNFVINRLKDFEPRRRHLQALAVKLTGRQDASPIVPVPAGGNELALRLARAFRDAGCWVSAIRHPTVPKGKECVRLSLTASMTMEEVCRLREVWEKIVPVEDGILVPCNS